MIVKTRGIVLNYIKYRDTSIIAKIYTENYGFQSYVIDGIRNPKSKKSIGSFQPLQLLELVAYQNDKKDIHRLSDCRVKSLQKSISLNLIKSTIALFLSEVLGKLLHGEKEENFELFNLLWDSILEFDHQKTTYENFHVQLLIQMAPYLGFAISNVDDLLQSSASSATLDANLMEYFNQIFLNEIHDIKANGLIRFSALEVILKFYSFHIDSLGEIKSLPVLRQIFV